MYVYKDAQPYRFISILLYLHLKNSDLTFQNQYILFECMFVRIFSLFFQLEKLTYYRDDTHFFQVKKIMIYSFDIS